MLTPIAVPMLSTSFSTEEAQPQRCAIWEAKHYRKTSTTETIYKPLCPCPLQLKPFALVSGASPESLKAAAELMIRNVKL